MLSIFCINDPYITLSSFSLCPTKICIESVETYAKMNICITKIFFCDTNINFFVLFRNISNKPWSPWHNIRKIFDEIRRSENLDLVKDDIKVTNAKQLKICFTDTYPKIAIILSYKEGYFTITSAKISPVTSHFKKKNSILKIDVWTER